MCEESHAHPGFDGVDEHGIHVNVIDVDRYLNAHPYKPPVKKKPASRPAPKPTPVAKKPTPKKEIKKYAPKPVPHLPGGKFSEFNVDEVISEAVIGGAISTCVTGTPVSGAIGGAAHVTGKWIWSNKKEIAKEYKKVSMLEDPMGKSFPH